MTVPALCYLADIFKKGCLEMFPSLCNAFAENDTSILPIQTLTSVHFDNLFKNLQKNGFVDFEWILNPFLKILKIQCYCTFCLFLINLHEFTS